MGAIIFNLDRYIVTSISKRDSNLKQLLSSLPRVLIAIILAITISKPLELKLFEGSILKHLGDKENEYIKNFEDNFNTKREALVNQTKQKPQIDIYSDVVLNDLTISENKLISSNNLLKNKIRSDTNKKHWIPLSAGIHKNDVAIKTLENKRVSRKQEITTTLAITERNSASVIAGIHTQITSMDSQRELLFSKNRLVISLDKDILSRLRVLGDIKDKDITARMASALITLLFMMIEISPILVKLIMSKGLYEEVLERNEKDVINNQILITENNLAKEKYRLIIELRANQTLVDYRVKKSLYLNKVSVDNKYDKKLKKISILSNT